MHGQGLHEHMSPVITRSRTSPRRRTFMSSEASDSNDAGTEVGANQISLRGPLSGVYKTCADDGVACCVGPMTRKRRSS